MNDFRIEIGKPSIVAQGDNTGWGNYQFPDIHYTKSGSIYVTWAMRPDDVNFYGGKSFGEAISDDLGVTWKEPDERCAVIPNTLLKNGKAFKGFKKEFAFKSDYIALHTPLVEHKGVKYHFVEDIKEFDDKVFGVEVDTETGEESLFEVKINWNNLALIEYPDSRILPTAYMMAACGEYAKALRIGDALYFATYHRSFDIHAKTRESAVNKYVLESSVFVFRSVDEARTWDCISQITVSDDEYREEDGFEGFDEPLMEIMADGSVVMLMRSGAPKSPFDPDRFPCYITRSTDACRTWSKPEKFDSVGVLPQLLRLGCGVTLATYGRPGLFLRATDDPSGREWAEHIEIDLVPNSHDRSCYYTRLLPIDDHSALLVYSDFNYPDKVSGKPKKTVLARRITVIKE